MDQQQRRAEVVRRVRALAATTTELGRAFARSRGMHTTDAAAVVEILTAEGRGEPLTPARLAERVSLTTGATSTLLNRLEQAGHVVRTREHRDRRVVTLRSTPGIHEEAESFYAPLGVDLDAALGEFSAAELDVAAAVVARLQEAMAHHVEPVKPR
ncbi:hypothetical protein GCM10011519_26640 [Marmoricola endophyticus]|uniref:HTH marR-type domain-containing protein n=1 Tax=Marmoricola endophyticus TaxID=2040280 RepID=A0A917BLX2_9ACTN|nr:MarR family transcriptional regulator [Marmoricola endophyticus]GGF51303.1 hypothetical protein GCM10011519_26640 [Marmoricola endophyticus]